MRPTSDQKLSSSHCFADKGNDKSQKLFYSVYEYVGYPLYDSIYKAV